MELSITHGFMKEPPVHTYDGFPCLGLLPDGRILSIVFVGEPDNGVWIDQETKVVVAPHKWKMTILSEAYIKRNAGRISRMSHGGWHA